MARKASLAQPERIGEVRYNFDLEILTGLPVLTGAPYEHRAKNSATNGSAGGRVTGVGCERSTIGQPVRSVSGVSRVLLAKEVRLPFIYEPS